MKMPFKILLLLVTFSIIQISCDTNKKSKEITNNSINQNKQGIVYLLTPNEFLEQSKGNIVVDIRTPYEFKRGHIKGAVNINYYDRNFTNNFAKFKKDQPIFLYCRSGNRTSSATKKLAKLGFLKIYDLKGGVQNWLRNNNQIER
ncbi:rhodanese-like domain-containing protein [Lutibacter sp.]